MIRPGDLRYYIRIEAPSAELDAAGQPQSWEKFADVYASLEPLSGRELLTAKQLATPVSTRVRMYYLPGVTPNMRVTYEGVSMQVQMVIDPGKLHQELELMCMEVE